MKYCPYCGAYVMDSAASFCTECGKRIVSSNRNDSSNLFKPIPKPTHLISKYRLLLNRLRGMIFKIKIFSPVAEKHPESDDEKNTESSSGDENYGGYYDDVVPVDIGQTREGIDPELIKRIIMVSIGALLIVALSIVVMNIL